MTLFYHIMSLAKGWDKEGMRRLTERVIVLRNLLSGNILETINKIIIVLIKVKMINATDLETKPQETFSRALSRAGSAYVTALTPKSTNYGKNSDK